MRDAEARFVRSRVSIGRKVWRVGVGMKVDRVVLLSWHPLVSSSQSRERVAFRLL